MHDLPAPTPLAYPLTNDDMVALMVRATDGLLLLSEEDWSDHEDEDAYRADLGRLIAVARGCVNVAAWNLAVEAGETANFTLPESVEEIEEARSGALTSLREDSFLR
jgi:hypothetical protein